jgi:asparagine synthetase B (glutamine-hydrolysing)
VNKFKTTRSDGRSNADVLVALVRDAEPGRLFSYQELTDTLSVGTDRTWDSKAVQSAVRASVKRMLRETSRMLYSVQGVGYRLSHGSDHSRLALVRERRSQTQLRAAVVVLKNARMDEMTPAQRTLHEAHLTITGAVCEQVSLLHRRQQKQDDAIASLLSRVQRLESVPA